MKILNNLWQNRLLGLINSIINAKLLPNFYAIGIIWDCITEDTHHSVTRLEFELYNLNRYIKVSGINVKYICNKVCGC